ncbi:carbon-nitrogen hydrolase [Lasiosphaeria ovina]|uniref:Carbon-nitrogen hydrolase n=1 Tax=Lasiosphaeria ovina TaxID=92902 RepID=A0AAE0NM20_9PEZI|nr:carbon-nitrogen hydrolase [Lasiosphaeria ovina]
MAPNYKIALIQVQPKDIDVKGNFSKAESYVRKAAAQGADLALLPEYHLTSWCPEHPDFVSASAESAAYLARYQALATELNINIVPGTICMPNPPRAEDPAADEEGRGGGSSVVVKLPDGTPVELWNMAYWISAGTGAIAGSYQKKNLWHAERPHLTAGYAAPHRAFDTPLRRADGTSVRAGLLVCWDLSFPEAFRALVADGADLVVVVSWWTMHDTSGPMRALNPASERVFLEAAVVARACENTCAVAFCNSGGLSQVAMPIVGPVGGAVAGVNTEEMRAVEVDLDVLRVAEDWYKIRSDLHGPGWHYGYTLYKDKDGVEADAVA